MASLTDSNTIFQLWSVQQSVLGSSAVARTDSSFESLQQWAIEKPAAAQDRTLIWTTELALIYAGKKLNNEMDSISSLLVSYGCDPLDVLCTSDTVQFNVQHSKRPWGAINKLMRPRRSYSVSDNTFGICWTWRPNERRTIGLMYGSFGEGWRQMNYILHGIQRSHTLRKNPMVVALWAMQAEILEMKMWVTNQAQATTEAHLKTGHHSYAYVGRAGVEGLDLALLSRDVCGLAVNITTSTLCLQRIVKLGQFIVSECGTVLDALNNMALEDSNLVDSVRSTNRDVMSRASVWQLRAEGLLEEAESWKYKAGILVQTVFTLATQKDQEIGIQIAHDSRTLAEKATRDSTSMKAIAAVTMCFLPGTFVASLFAMPMFDWKPSPGRTVSAQFWVYWAVTLPLTFAVICVWFLWVNYPALNSPRVARTPDMPHRGAKTHPETI